MAFSLIAGAAQIQGDTSGECGYLDLAVVDSFGSRIAGFRAELRRAGATQRLTWKPGERLPYGDYTLSVAASGFRTHRREIAVNSIGKKLVVALTVVGFEPAGAIAFSRDPAWLACDHFLLIPVFFPSGERVVTALGNGATYVSGLPVGAYIAVVEGPSGRCGLVPLNITSLSGQKIILGPATNSATRD